QMIRNRSFDTVRKVLDDQRQRTRLVEYIAAEMQARRLRAADLQQIIPTLSPKQVSRLRDGDWTVCSAERLQLIATALENESMILIIARSPTHARRSARRPTPCREVR